MKLLPTICFLLLSLLTIEVFSLCPYECDCSNEPKQCPPGVSLVTDGCNCCKVCARQVNEECNDDDMLCDPHRGLFCDFAQGRTGDYGVCSVRSGRACWHGDVRITSGSRFEPSCKQRCWCLDGSFGCLPLCPHETHTPRADLCPNARLQSVPGECCDQWICDTPSGHARVLPLDNFWNDYVSESATSTTPDAGNSIRDVAAYDDDVDEDNEFESQFPGGGTDLAGFHPGEKWHMSNNILPGDDNDRDALKAAAWKAKCHAKASAWSPCSKTCGLGISTRVSNVNEDCSLSREMRLCLIRPCQMARYEPKKGRQCLRQKRSRKRVAITYAGCQSVRRAKQRYCGSCQEQNRCCTPKVTRNMKMRFRCSDGRYFSKTMMVIRSCSCHKNCAAQTSSSTQSQSAVYALFRDVLRQNRR